MCVCVSTFTGWGWCYTVFFLREVWGVRQSLVPALFESITSLFSVNSNPTASSYKSQKKVACIDRGGSRLGILTQNRVLSSPGPLLKMERLVSMVITHLHATDRDKRRAIKRVRPRLSWHTHIRTHFWYLPHQSKSQTLMHFMKRTHICTCKKMYWSCTTSELVSIRPLNGYCLPSSEHFCARQVIYCISVRHIHRFINTGYACAQERLDLHQTKNRWSISLSLSLAHTHPHNKHNLELTHKLPTHLYV